MRELLTGDGPVVTHLHGIAGVGKSRRGAGRMIGLAGLRARRRVAVLQSTGR